MHGISQEPDSRWPRFGFAGFFFLSLSRHCFEGLVLARTGMHATLSDWLVPVPADSIV